MTKETRTADVVIIGAGFAGLGVGIALRNKKINDFVIFEGEDGVGGSWRTNTYPGCACDVPSQLYSYSFELNPDWKEAYSTQEDIRKYIEHCADKYSLRPNIRFNTKVTGAEFVEAKGVWRVTTDDGVVTEAPVLVPATGALSHPKFPDIDGRDQFAGTTLHTARWDADIDLKGKRVGVIGTGASAIQVVPSIAPDVADLLVFQRTPSWVLPRWNREFTEKEHARWARFPFLQRFRRLLIYWLMESTLPGIMWFPGMLKMGEELHKKALNKAIRDPELRAQLTPDYRIGCKRTLVSDDYFPAIARDNVHLICDAIEKITADGIRLKNGKEHEFDVLIYASGYEIGAPAYPFEIRGLGDIKLSEYWGGQSKAYYGMNVSHFPNMLVMMGPNTGPGHTSVLIYQEAQYKYVAKYTDYLLKNRIKYLNVKEQIQNEQFQWFQNRMKNSSWLSGCSSWYLNEDGTNSTMWPGFSFEYVLRTSRFNPKVYDAVPQT
ncbi:MAG: NAD(P)/FAD-dependent oxidoreductase [Gammaproteobacteria bacterium]|jgi:cation diffusion facilitator CzcD-associated flavoprotein CzcO|nr:NAD(P)/FAD-dependent oxidoreductase [Gammaproteobacteria bacterium]